MQLTIAEIKSLFPDHTLRLEDATLPAGVSKDTRTLKKGEIYIALRGEVFDGHQFVEQAFAQGALMALVEYGFPPRDNLAYCPDTLKGLTLMARTHRHKFNQPLIAITGSNGKTTTKEFLAHVLRLGGPVTATQGNLNNHIGVPLTLLQLDPAVHAIIIEMGMNHKGEIRHLAQLAIPDMAIITSIGHAHLEGVGGRLEDIAEAKGELFAELTQTGTALVNLDEPLIAALPTRARRITYGLAKDADVRADNIHVSGGKTAFRLIYKEHGSWREHPVTLKLVGEHHVRNALAVFASAHQLQMGVEQIITGIESFTLDMNRGRIVELSGLTIVDDSYNANPDSMIAAFESLRLQFPGKTRVAALGDMRELGPRAAQLHQWVGEQARLHGIDDLFVLGEHAEKYLEGFGPPRGNSGQRVFSDHHQLASAFREAYKDRPGTVLLVKGSRLNTMEKILPYV